MLRILLYIFIVLILLAIALRIAIPFISSQPDNLGVNNGQLAPCPDSPNCVSSFETSDGHKIDPIPFTGNIEETRTKLLATLNAMPRVNIITAQPTYIHATTRSRLMGFVDDNEFLLDEAAGEIHVRAAARLGQSDMGANRARVERIRGQMK